MALFAATKSVFDGSRHQHQAAGHVAGREDVRRGGLQELIHLDVPARIELDARYAEIHLGGVGDPARGHHDQRGLGALVATAVAEVHAHSGRRLLERRDRAESFAHRHARLAKTGRDGGRDRLVRRAQNARAPLEELNLRAERMEHGGDLHARVPAADDQHRRWHLGQLPGVAVRVGELDAGNGESSAHAPGAEDELRRFEPESAFGFDRVRAGEAGRAGLLVDRHAERIGSLAQGRVRAHARARLRARAPAAGRTATRARSA